MGNAWRREPRASSTLQSKGEVTALTIVADLRTEFASYNSHMSFTVQALNRSGFRLPDIRPLSTSELFQLEHAQNFAHSTSELVLNLSLSCPNLSSRMQTTTP
ncbi:hypothetical protein ACFX2B_024554 [Malus domestica]